MNNRDWEILSTLQKEQSLSRCAYKLFMSQPALTTRIKKIEKELGVKIGHRTKKGLRLTPQGEYLASEGLGLLKSYEDLKGQLWNMDEELTGTLKIGLSNFMTRYLIPDILQSFKKKYPLVNYKVISGWSKDMFKLMYRGDVHISFIRGDYTWHDQMELLFKEPVCIVSKEKIDLEDLPHLPRIDYDTDIKLKNLIDNWWMKNYSKPPYISMVVNQTDTCLEMVKSGLGYAILPRLVLHEIDNLYSIDIMDRDNNPIVRNSWMIYQQKTLELRLVREFVHFVRQQQF